MPTTQVKGAGVVSGGGAALPTGAVVSIGMSTIPSGWLECDGSAVSRTTYADLFAIISTTFGVGDGSTTFNLPDLRGRHPIGSGTGAGLTTRVIGDMDGEESVTMIEAELPSHTHSVSPTTAGNLYTAGPNAHTVARSGAGTVISTSSGSGTAHNNMSPFKVTGYMIKT